jgi:hypothetical protein
VTEALLNDLGVDALLKEQRRVTVPKVVEPDARNAGASRNERQIALRNVVRVERLPVRLAEDQAVVVIAFAEFLAMDDLLIL